jgi:hypothetical protein
LWLEYKAAHPDGYQYTQFCAHYGRWLATLDPVLRQGSNKGRALKMLRESIGGMNQSRVGHWAFRASRAAVNESTGLGSNKI